jgi:hypothetical protein
LGLRFPNQPNDGGVVGQRLTGPVVADLAKDAVLNGISLGGAGWIVTNGHHQFKGVG